MLSKLEREMQLVLKSLEILELLNPDDGVYREIQFDAVKVGEMLRKLLKYVLEDNLEAVRCMEEIREYMGASIFCEEIQEMNECINNYDFDGVKEPLKEIAKVLNISIEGCGKNV